MARSNCSVASMIYDMPLNELCARLRAENLFKANHIKHGITGSGQIISLVLLCCARKNHVRASVCTQFRLLYSNLNTSGEQSGRMRERESQAMAAKKHTHNNFNEKD